MGVSAVAGEREEEEERSEVCSRASRKQRRESERVRVTEERREERRDEKKRRLCSLFGGKAYAEGRSGRVKRERERSEGARVGQVRSQ